MIPMKTETAGSVMLEDMISQPPRASECRMHIQIWIHILNWVMLSELGYADL
jgi:hypothetical protein